MATPPTKAELQAAAKSRSDAAAKRRREEALAAANQPSSVQGRTQGAAAGFKPDSPGYKKGGNVKKYLSGGDILGTLSPLYGAATGKGAFGKNDLGIMSALARRARKRRPDGTEMTEGEEIASGRPTMKRGGKVKKYARGGGIESKGKTKGRFV